LYHIPLTAFLWTATLMLALVASSLSDVVNVLGCTTGTPIAFLQPPLLAWRLQDYSLKSTTLFTVCFSVGCIGTYFSLHKLF
jgi:amino acid permease